jgi:hypothetical protein
MTSKLKIYYQCKIMKSTMSLKYFFTRKILVKVALFYTKNRSEGSVFLDHFIPFPWR